MNEDVLVVQKHNQLVRKSINKFSYKQNQLICILLGKYIHTKDNICIDTTISINELRQALGLSDGKDNYRAIKKAVDDFGANGSVGIYDEKNEKYIWRPFFKQITLSKTEVTFEWNDAMKEDLINLKNKYTSYLANDYLKLSSVYSQNLYEQLKSYENLPKKPQIAFTVSDLHRIMQTEKIKSYQTFNKFKTKVIERALDDINKKTDIKVEIDVIKDPRDKRKAIGVAFTIHNKNDKYNYKGCWLNEHEIEDIIYNHKSKNKILELAEIKEKKKNYYTLLRKNNKSDYDIILNFIKNDSRDEEIEDTPEVLQTTHKIETEEIDEEKTIEFHKLMACLGNKDSIDFCKKNGIEYE